MDDLISRKDVLKLFPINDCSDKMVGLYERVLDIPTSYDVDKVVEKLEELKTKYKKLIEICEDKFEAFELECKCIQISKDIEIVKRGGVE